jgi:MFS transporter, ACS family, tartrate transporter
MTVGASDRVFEKCARRLMPLIMAMFLVNIFDRVNVSFAALTMNRDLGFSPAVYGFGAGLFFFGYSLFQIPGNLILQRVGARRWIFCILAIWGAVSSGMSLIQSPNQFYVARVALGLAEAGFFPGMVLYMTYWFPRSYRARFVAGLNSAGTMAFVFGGPVASLILQLDRFLGLHGWQWLFLLEGTPAIALAFAALKWLPDGPADARWLSESEKQTIARRLASEETPAPSDVWAGLLDVRVLALGLAYAGQQAAQFGLVLWIPQIVQAMGVSDLATGFVVALPYLVAAGAMNIWALSSDRSGDHVRHVLIPALLIMSALLVTSVSPYASVAFLALSIAIVSSACLFGPFWALPSSFLQGSAAAAGFAFINAVGAGLGGFAGPAIIGLLKGSTGNYGAATATLAVAPALTATIVFLLARSLPLKRELAAASIAEGRT